MIGRKQDATKREGTKPHKTIQDMEESDFKKMMQQSELEIEFPDFEEDLMQKIKAKEANRRSVWRNLKISWIFFFIGAFFGIFAAQFLADIKIPLFGDNQKIVLLLVEIFIVIIVASQFDNLIRFTFRRKG